MFENFSVQTLFFILFYIFPSFIFAANSQTYPVSKTHIEIGGVAPSFSAPNQDGQIRKLSDFKEKTVLLYFYPKDDTPGCTKEACQLRDRFSEFQKAGAVVLGISRQNDLSHREFRAKHKLPFDLLTDKDGTIADLYEVGTIPFLGFHKRQSILIGPDGKIIKIYREVNPLNHAKEVLQDLLDSKTQNQEVKRSPLVLPSR